MKRFLLLLMALTVFAFAPTAQASMWIIDPAHSNVQFKIQHMMISYVRGSFSELEGTIELNEEDISKSTINVTIATASIDTNNAKRDKHLRSGDFFDVETFPAMTYRSKSISPQEQNTLKVFGSLTLHGITKEVILEVTGPTPPVTDPWGNVRRGAQATASLNRKDFGLTWNKVLETGGLLVGDKVKILIEVELIKKDS